MYVYRKEKSIQGIIQNVIYIHTYIYIYIIDGEIWDFIFMRSQERHISNY